MANEEQLAILKQGVDVWNQWRKENPENNINLRNANLNRYNLVRGNFGEADLRGATLKEANLGGADFLYARLQKSNLIKANLQDAELWFANLEGANLTETDLIRTDFTGAMLDHAILKKANLIGTLFLETALHNTSFEKAEFTIVVLSNTNLSTCLGLETTMHLGGSTIGIDTIQNSKGKIPVEFLRGCGMSDLDIEYAKLAAPGLDEEQISQIIYEVHDIYFDQPIQFYSCFISYNNKDQAFAQRLHDDLQNSGVRCWFAPEDMKIGDRIRPTIDRQIRMREKLIVILSENSLQSEWVGDEVEAAMEQEKESGKTVLFPIRLDDAVLNTRDDWAAKIKRRRNIGDFSSWNDEVKYQKMFERLLRDLRAQ